MLTNLFLGQTAEEKNFIEDLFSCYLYTGNGSTQTITNGIDLAGKGGMVWLKIRSYPGFYPDHYLIDTERGGTQQLFSNKTNAQSTGNANISFSSSGFNLLQSGNNSNGADQTYASWTFRKAPKFFDVVTWSGNSTNRTISHSLGSVPGMIIVKRTDSAADWQVYHRSLANTEYVVLNTTAAKATGTTRWNSTTPTATEFSLGTDATVNASGGSYVAYLFAHDTTADGVIQCGSYTGNGSTSGPSISLGWEPQYVLIKNTTAATGWLVFDTMRGMPVGSAIDYYLFANTSDAEAGTQAYIDPTATGFNIVAGSGFINNASNTYIYLAIRRGPMRVPTDATKVFNSVTRSTNGTATTVTANLSPVDLVINGVRTSWGGGESNATFDRLRGTPILRTNSTSSELTNDAFYGFDVQQGYRLGPDTDGWGTNNTYYGTLNTVLWNFRRAPGFFDVTCYSGTGATLSVGHNLGVVPELIILKRRNASSSWPVWRTATGTGTTFGYLNDSGAEADQGVSILTASPTSSAFSVGAWGPINASGGTYVAYLFASCPGVSKVGTYTGTGTTNQINCGFTNGARFVLIKRTDSTGDWTVWDTARGIVSGNDPYLFLNSAAAEVTNTDYIDPYSAGFEISSTAPAAINANGGTYIFLAIS